MDSATVGMTRSDYSAASVEARAALDLFVQWGCAWDKRLTWDAWVAWTRVVLQVRTAVLLWSVAVMRVCVHVHTW